MSQPERPLFADVARPRRSGTDPRARTLYLLIVLVLVAASVLFVAELSRRERLVVVEVDLHARPEAPAP